ncbi:hypothetical protein CMEL01_02194 [Colletotrichum melonis]|uniref:Uncharacterized protein n=2 Tax=Colletotrichum acutatum species complex TaxID=2707335 RepID=A0AAI9UM99_9PEZI|nr:hypothetical protein CMEL01_02194 [Colletotrichum melonis]KAK1496322.1 hypothetical protein CCUS01_13349 [Colletotrichum cuscutae]
MFNRDLHVRQVHRCRLQLCPQGQMFEGVSQTEGLLSCISHHHAPFHLCLSRVYHVANTGSFNHKRLLPAKQDNDGRSTIDQSLKLRTLLRSTQSFLWAS